MINSVNLADILLKHKLWLDDHPDGVRADLTEADLTGANLAGAILTEADLTEADLTGANLIGADLTGASLTKADLTDANLSGAILTGADLTRADLTDANLTGADLTGANLTDTDLTGTYLTRAKLTNAILSGVNLADADLSGVTLTGDTLVSVDRGGPGGVLEIPIVPDLDAAIHAQVCGAGAPGTLDMASWHTCETTHCRAGWAIHLAGEAGRNLEDAIGSCAAAALIYHASTGRVPDFYASCADALADICQLAEVKP